MFEEVKHVMINNLVDMKRHRRRSRYTALLLPLIQVHRMQAFLESESKFIHIIPHIVSGLFPSFQCFLAHGVYALLFVSLLIRLENAIHHRNQRDKVPSTNSLHLPEAEV